MLTNSNILPYTSVSLSFKKGEARLVQFFFLFSLKIPSCTSSSMIQFYHSHQQIYCHNHYNKMPIWTDIYLSQSARSLIFSYKGQYFEISTVSGYSSTYTDSEFFSTTKNTYFHQLLYFFFRNFLIESILFHKYPSINNNFCIITIITLAFVHLA